MGWGLRINDNYEHSVYFGFFLNQMKRNMKLRISTETKRIKFIIYM